VDGELSAQEQHRTDSCKRLSMAGDPAQFGLKGRKIHEP
jgi:hypothetical protein